MYIHLSLYIYICGEVPYVAPCCSLRCSLFPTKFPTKFTTGSTITKVNTEHLEKVTKTFLRNVFLLTFVSMATVVA